MGRSHSFPSLSCHFSVTSGLVRQLRYLESMAFENEKERQAVKRPRLTIAISMSATIGFLVPWLVMATHHDAFSVRVLPHLVNAPLVSVRDRLTGREVVTKSAIRTGRKRSLPRSLAAPISVDDRLRTLRAEENTAPSTVRKHSFPQPWPTAKANPCRDSC